MVVTNLKNSFHPVPKVKDVKKNINKRIKQRSSKLAKMEKRRFSIITNNFENCYLCNSELNEYSVNKHEVFFGTGNRKRSIKYGLIVPLCENCHTKGKLSVHNNFFKDLELKKIAQKKFEEKHTRDEFIRIFGKSYL